MQALVTGRHLHTAAEADAGLRLDQLLSRLHPELSRARIQSLIDEGQVTVGGAPAKPSRRVKAGEAIELTVPDVRPVALVPQDLPLSKLYEDKELVVLDKAAGVVVHPGAGVEDGTLVNALLFHLPDLEGISGELRPGVVHRLDKDTSGCLVVAKNERALRALQAAFQERAVEKRYLALCHGEPREEAFTIDTPYGRHPTDRVRYTSKRPAGPPRRAVTHVKVAERFGGAALCEVGLETGRTHQIRVHLADLGHPLLADALYGGQKREAKLPAHSPIRRAAEAVGRQALHAAFLSFPHPVTGERLSFSAPVPKDLERALAVLRGVRSP